MRKQHLGLIAGAAILAEATLVWQRAGKPGGNLIVRCRQGHLFTTLWIPAASVKSVRLGPWRFQRCPVGHHWSLVTPVNEASLSEDARRLARAHHDVPLP